MEANLKITQASQGDFLITRPAKQVIYQFFLIKDTWTHVDLFGFVTVRITRKPLCLCSYHALHTIL